MSLSSTSKTLKKTLAGILDDTAREIAHDKRNEPLHEVKRKAFSPSEKIISFYDALSAPGVGLVAEIKECSPSKGLMNPDNVRNAAEAYKKSWCVRAISVLTSRTNFGKSMTLAHLLEVKRAIKKPVLRKDFIYDEYQVYQARAYGADAILLMAHVVKKQELKKLFSIASDLGMDVLFETHTPEEIDKIPDGARIYGINSRDFCSRKFSRSRVWGRCLRLFGMRPDKDTSVDLNRFSYCNQLPESALKIAESGVSPETCHKVFAEGFNSILVGTSLLYGKQPVEETLRRFEAEIQKLEGIFAGKSERSSQPLFTPANA